MLAIVDALAAARDLREGRAMFASMTSGDSSLDDRAGRAAARAAAEFAAARDRAGGSPWLSLWSRVPFAGRSARWLRLATAQADVVARAGAASVDRLVARFAARAPSERLTLIREVAAEARRLAAVLDRVKIPAPNAFLPPVDGAHRRLSATLERAREGARRGIAIARGLEELLRGPTRYLVLAANNAEMRAGGMVLQVGLLETDAGVIRAGGFRPTAELVLKRPVAVPPEIASLYGFLDPGLEWRNTGSSPNFAAIGPVYAAMGEAAGFGRVDGVLHIDVIALRQLLSALGPVGSGGRRFDETNVARLLMHDLYAIAGPKQEQRREEFSGLAAATFEALDARAWDAGEMARAIGDAAAGRHLLAWSRRPAQQAAWRAAGVDGALDPDGLMITVQNHGGNKLDWFLGVRAALTTQDAPGGWRRASLRIDLSNRYPEGEVPYVAGDGSVAPVGAYRGLVAVYLPAAAINVEPAGGRVVGVGTDGGLRVVAMRLTIARGGRRTLTVRFSIPPGERRVVLLPAGRARPILVRYHGRSVDDARARFLRI